MIELLVVLIVIGILPAIALPSYLAFKSRAYDAVAKANVRKAGPAVEAYSAENNGEVGDSDLEATTVGYEGMTIAQLQEIDSSISAATLTVRALSHASFCVSSTHNGHVWHQEGPSDPIVSGACP